MIEIYNNEDFDKNAIKEYEFIKYQEIQQLKKEFDEDELRHSKKFENNILKLDLIW